MEVFEGAHFVRLRSGVRRRHYLAGEDDGLHVCLSPHHDAHNTVWAVQHFDGPPSDGASGGPEAGTGPYVLLRGAFGRYLFATDRQATTGPSHGVTAVQHGNYSEQPTPPGMLWQAVPRRASYVIRNATGRYLRANGRYLRWRTAVTVAGDTASTMMQWSVEVVAPRVNRPSLLDPPIQKSRRDPTHPASISTPLSSLRRSMEVFQGAHFVRLRSRVRRSCYVAAEDDGLGVCLAERRAAHNTVWAVQHFAGPPSAGASGGVQAGHGPYVLLRGAYGRYLFATDRQATTGPSHGVTAVQHGNYSEQPTPPGFLWHAVPRRTSFVIRNATGRYLRANGRYLRWRTAVTVAGDSSSTMLQWAIEVVPLRVGRPTLVDQPVQLTRRRTPPTEGQVTRMIRYVRADPNGNFSEQAFRTIRVNNHSLMQLRLTLANRLGQNRSALHNMLCVRAGRYAQLSPLLIDLPIGTDRIDIVLLAHGTPAELALRYPNVDAE